MQEHTTTVNRINQLLADGLIRSADRNTDDTAHRLVVFSDSRQNAAKLASGVELEHYRDLVRQSLMKYFAESTGLRDLALKYLVGGRESLSDNSKRDRSVFPASEAQVSRYCRDWRFP